MTKDFAHKVVDFIDFLLQRDKKAGYPQPHSFVYKGDFISYLDLRKEGFDQETVEAIVDQLITQHILLTQHILPQPTQSKYITLDSDFQNKCLSIDMSSHREKISRYKKELVKQYQMKTGKVQIYIDKDIVFYRDENKEISHGFGGEKNQKIAEIIVTGGNFVAKENPHIFNIERKDLSKKVGDVIGEMNQTLAKKLKLTKGSKVFHSPQKRGYTLNERDFDFIRT